MKTVSVVIPNYNYSEFICDAIESALDQTYKPLQIIVVDDGSSDNSLEVVRQYLKHITLIVQQNSGQSAARNAGIREAQGDYVALLDADDYWNPNKLDHQMKLLNQKTQVVYCGLRVFDNLSNATLVNLMPKYRGECKSHFLNLNAASIVLGGESTSVFSRELAAKVKGFDTRLNVMGGWDFFRKCSNYTSFDFVNDSLVNYRRHEKNVSSKMDNNCRDIRNAYEILFKDSEEHLNFLQEIRIKSRIEISLFKTTLRENSRFKNFRKQANSS